MTDLHSPPASRANLRAAMNAPAPRVGIPLRPDPLARRNAGITAVMRAATAQIRSVIDGGNPVQYAEPTDREVNWLLTKMTVKNAVEMASPENTPALLQTVVADFVASLAPAYASAEFLAQTLRLIFDRNNVISVPGFVADPNAASFVKPGTPIPVRSRLVKPCELQPYKIATISTMTIEMATGSNAEAMLKDVLKQDIGLAHDAALFDANPAIPETRPAGLRNGIVALPATGGSDATASMIGDIAAVAGAVAPVAGNSPVILVANPTRALTLRLRSPHGLPLIVLASSAIAPADLIAIAPSAVVSATSSVPEFEASRETTVHQDDAPTNISAPGSLNVVAAPVVSMFQTGCIALKCRMLASWARRDDRAVAWLTTSAW